MRVESVPVSKITVGERRREEFGDLDGLSESIAKFGLFHPVVVDDAGNLIAGERRLRACRDILGWTEISCRLYDDLSDDERREIELEENTCRKDLTPFEASKQTVKKAEKVAPLISTQTVEIKNDAQTNPKGAGRKSSYEAPKKDVAQALGISTSSLVNAEKHVEAVTKYPELSVVPTQKGAIEAAKKLDALPERERDAALSRIVTEGKSAVADITSKPKPNKPPKPKSAGGQYAANLSQIQVFISSIQNVGTEELTANWTEREAHDFLANLRECRDGISAIVSDLEKTERQRAGEAA